MAVSTKEMNRMMVADLRAELKRFNLKVSGTKQELIDRLSKHFKSLKSQSVKATKASGKKLPHAGTQDIAGPSLKVPKTSFAEEGPEARLDSEKLPTDAASESAKVACGIIAPSCTTETMPLPLADPEVPVADKSCAVEQPIAANSVVIGLAETISEARPFEEINLIGLIAPSEPSTVVEQLQAPITEVTSPKKGSTQMTGELTPAHVRRIAQVVTPSRSRASPATASFFNCSPPPTSAMLAQEVSVEDNVKESTPDITESARKSWRELCAREAACFRRTSSENSNSEEIIEPAANGVPLAEFIAATARASARAEKSTSRSRSPFEERPMAVRSKAILKRPADIHNQSRFTLLSSRQSESSSSNRSSSSSSSGGSPSATRSPSPQHGAQNCSSSLQQRSVTPHAASVEDEKSCATPILTPRARSKLVEDRSCVAFLRAEHLRAELVAGAAPSELKSPLVPNCSGTSSHYEKSSAFEAPSSSPATVPSPLAVACAPMPNAASVSFAMQSPSACARMVISPSPRSGVAQSPSSCIERSILESPRDHILGGKNKLLEQLTSQLQVCLARLQDKNLAEASKEKYQKLALSLKAQLDKTSSLRMPAFTSAPSPVIARKGGC